MGRKIAFGVFVALTALTAVAACTILVLPREVLAQAGRWAGVFPA